MDTKMIYSEYYRYCTNIYIIKIFVSISITRTVLNLLYGYQNDIF